MKSMKVWMVALLLVTAVLVLPVSARTGYNVIDNGDTIFLYENDLDMTALNFSTTPYKLIAFSEGDPVDTVTFSTLNNFDVPDDMMVGKVYYAYGGSVATGESVTIDKPYVTVDVMLAGGADKLNEKTITKGTNLEFRLKSNVPAGMNASTPVYVELRFTNPDGGTVNAFGDLEGTAGVVLNADEIRTAPAETDDPDHPVKSGLWKVQALWRPTAPTGFPACPACFNDFYQDGVDSAIVPFTISAGEVKIASSKDQVIRGNGFTITITGRGSATFYLFIKDAGLDACNEYPFVDPYGVDLQPGVSPLNPGDLAAIEAMGGNPSGCDETMVRVRLTAAGSRTVTFSTDEETEDRTFTFDVIDVIDEDNKDTKNVEVTRGTISIDAKGDKIYFSGEEITFMGENTDSDRLFLMIVGPNLDECGAPIHDPFDQGLYDATNKLKDDNTWEYKWDTSIIDTLDAGSYTIYALSKDQYYDVAEDEWIAIDKCNLGDGDEEYDLVTITLKKPFLTASIPSARVAKGDTLTLTGMAEGTPDTIWYWVFGPNLGRAWFDQPIAVEDDNTFEEDLPSTVGLQSGQYYIVVQHPMYNGDQDAFMDCEGDMCGVFQGDIFEVPQFWLTGRERLMGSDAAFAFIDVLNDPRIDDSYVKLTFILDEPWIDIDPVSDKFIGDKFVLKGTTNNAVDDTVLITITSATFEPTAKGTSSEFGGSSYAVKVVKGTGDVNTWSQEVDTATFRPDEYIINVEVVETGATSTGTFFVSDVPPTTAPTPPPVTTAPVTTVVTTAPPTTTVPPTTTPGFGAVIALIGLGAVAVLVLRRH